MSMVGQSGDQVVFVTSNPNNVLEVRGILGEYGITFEHLNLRYPEIQSDSLHQIASASARYLYRRLKCPLFVEDSGIFVDSLNGFPGPYSSYVQKTIGNPGILKLMESVPCRGSRFESVVAYIKSADDLHLFSGIVEGSISKKMKGKEWGFDPIFIPLGSTQTYAEMGIEAKQKLSHRRAAIERLAIWMTRKVSKR